MNQIALFEMPAEPSPLSLRDKARDAVMKKAGEAFRNAFRAFVIEFLRTNGPSNGEEIRNAYLQTRLPRPLAGWQGTGGIYHRLRKDGVIREVGKKRSSVWGNDLSVIALTEAK